MTRRAETGRIQAPRQIKQAGLKMIQTSNPGAETYRPKTGAQSSDLQLSEIYHGVNKEENIDRLTTVLSVQTAAGMTEGRMRGITKAASGKAKQRNTNEQQVNKIMSPGMLWVGIN